MAMIVRPRNAATAASLATKVLAAASGMIARGAVNKMTNKASDLALKGAKNLFNKVVGDTELVTTTARTRRRGRNRGKNTSLGLLQNTTIDNPPMAIFSGAPRITFGISGRPQKNVEIGDNGIRVCGTDLFEWVINSDATDAHKIFKSGVAANTDNIYIEPNSVSPRLSQFMLMFTYYAFRRLRFIYTPTVGTNTGGAIAISISSDINSLQATTSLQRVLQNQHSMITEVWRPSYVEITHTGTKVFTPYTSENYSSQDRFQFEVDGCFSSLLASATYGVLFVEYEIDFYSPVFTHSGYTSQQKAPAPPKYPYRPINETDVGKFRDSALLPGCSRKDELKSQVGDPTNQNTVAAPNACNGTGNNGVIDPAYEYLARYRNGSGENTNITGGYAPGSNGTGANQRIGYPDERSMGQLPTPRY